MKKYEETDRSTLPEYKAFVACVNKIKVGEPGYIEYFEERLLYYRQYPDAK